ncbi:MAG: hypothetical protein Q4E57_08260 [Eubacteriales bacterium]|nr:hypothetical protein [Eubacteriales bacterium]
MCIRNQNKQIFRKKIGPFLLLFAVLAITTSCSKQSINGSPSEIVSAAQSLWPCQKADVRVSGYVSEIILQDEIALVYLTDHSYDVWSTNKSVCCVCSPVDAAFLKKGDSEKTMIDGSLTARGDRIKADLVRLEDCMIWVSTDVGMS